MADITMCTGEGCDKKTSCYRYKASPNRYWQAYFLNPPVKQEEECTKYWRLEEGDSSV